MSDLRIETFRSIGDVAPLRAQIDALNLAARRPCPFSTYEYISTFVAHDEYASGEEELLFLAAFDGDRLVGYLPLRKWRDHVLGVPFGRIGVLVSHDTDRPHLVARPEDEARCTGAFYDELLNHEGGWSFLELAMQDADSALNRVPRLSPARFLARRFENMPNSTMHLPRTLAEYLAALSPSEQDNLARYGRRLFAEGAIELVTCDDPSGRSAMLDLYLDVERRSWKEQAHAGIRRDRRRLAFFRALTARDQPLALAVDLLLLDGLPIAALLRGSFAGNMYALEFAFDEAFTALRAGNMIGLLSVLRTIEAGYSTYNWGGNYAYYKGKIGAEVTATNAVQIYRVGSVPWLRAVAGSLRRSMAKPYEAPTFNAERREVREARGNEPAPIRDKERSSAQERLASLEAAGVVLNRLSGAALEAAIPLRLRKKGNGKKKEAA